MQNYYTVSEYAIHVGKDPGNIRRMLIDGIIPGEKLGKQWIIPKDTIYPEDRRVKNGEYRNWRKRIRINREVPELLRRLTEMSRRIGEIYGPAIDSVILYGSYARGDQTAESDIDIAVLINDGGTEKMHDQMLSLVVDYELELEVTLSVVSVDYKNYSEWKHLLPFYKNIEKEGIVLWKAA